MALPQWYLEYLAKGRENKAVPVPKLDFTTPQTVSPPTPPTIPISPPSTYRTNPNLIDLLSPAAVTPAAVIRQLSPVQQIEVDNYKRASGQDPRIGEGVRDEMLGLDAARAAAKVKPKAYTSRLLPEERKTTVSDLIDKGWRLYDTAPAGTKTTVGELVAKDQIPVNYTPRVLSDTEQLIRNIILSLI